MKARDSTYFNLEKFYFDCIDDVGNCFVIYWAYLEIYCLKFHYSGMIFSDCNNVITKKSTFKKAPKPLINKILSIDNSLMQIKGNWNRTDNPILLSLFKDGTNRELLWECHHPKALAEIEYYNKIFKGLGYAERLSLPIKPWNLPFQELRWGRFLSDDYTIIWIHWKGEKPLNKLFCNGTEYDDAIFLVDRVIFNKGRYVLFFKDISTLRSGIISNILSKPHILKTILNRCILNGNEIKCKAKTTLSRDDEIVAYGWSLYETVTWKR